MPLSLRSWLPRFPGLQMLLFGRGSVHLHFFEEFLTWCCPPWRHVFSVLLGSWVSSSYLGVFLSPPLLCSAFSHTSYLPICSGMFRRALRRPRSAGSSSSLLFCRSIWCLLCFSCHLLRSSFRENCNTVLNSRLGIGSPCFVPLLIGNTSRSSSVKTVPSCWPKSLFRSSTYGGSIP